MTNNKNKNIKKNNEVKKEEVVDNSKVIKEFIIIIVVIALIFAIVYLLTVGAKKIGWFDPHYVKPEVEEAVISYENIEVGTMFDRAEEEYYVILADSEDSKYYLNVLIDNYEEKEDSLKLYFVNLSDGLNKSVVSTESSITSSKVTEIKVNDVTLFHVKNNKNIGAFSGIENVVNMLK